MFEVEVTGPLSERVTAKWALLVNNSTAVIEMAAASGLGLVPLEELNPLVTTTFGTGELIREALDRGCRKFIVGIGGSATNDGGAGMAQALGVRLLDVKGQPIAPGGRALAGLKTIDMSGIDPRLIECDVTVASDVTNPLCGPDGASFTYGPQKGATPEIAAELDEALTRYADIISHELGIEVKDVPGAGAAGGLGAGLIAFLGAKVLPGVEVVMQATGLAEKMKGADLVFTGEGRVDGQTSHGKTPVGVARKAKELGIPVIAITGEIGTDYKSIYEEGIISVFSIAPGPISFGESAEKAEELTSDITERALRLFINRSR
jgi:glycerate kinase